MSVSHIPSSEP